jgi:hypothetical protein
MPSPLRPEISGHSPIVGVRLPADVRDRVIELAGPGYGALSAFVRQAVLRELDRAEPEPPEKAADLGLYRR